MMTAEKLDEADALHWQYGKSESINLSLSLSTTNQSNQLGLRFFLDSGLYSMQPFNQTKQVGIT